VPELPVISRYIERLADRPARARAKAIDEKLGAEQEAAAAKAQA
jgi:hypothetical protein